MDAEGIEPSSARLQGGPASLAVRARSQREWRREDSNLYLSYFTPPLCLLSNRTRVRHSSFGTRHSLGLNECRMPNLDCRPNSGSGTRTHDLRLMRPASCRCSIPLAQTRLRQVVARGPRRGAAGFEPELTFRRTPSYQCTPAGILSHVKGAEWDSNPILPAHNGVLLPGELSAPTVRNTKTPAGLEPASPGVAIRSLGRLGTGPMTAQIGLDGIEPSHSRLSSERSAAELRPS